MSWFLESASETKENWGKSPEVSTSVHQEEEGTDKIHSDEDEYQNSDCHGSVADIEDLEVQECRIIADGCSSESKEPVWVTTLKSYGLQIRSPQFGSFYEPTTEKGFCPRDCVFKETGGVLYRTVTTTNGVEWVVVLYREREDGPLLPLLGCPVQNVMCAVAGSTTKMTREHRNLSEIFGTWAMRRGWPQLSFSELPKEDIFDSFVNGMSGYVQLYKRPIVHWQETVAVWKLKTKSPWSHNELVNDGQVIRDQCMEPLDALAIVYQVCHE